MTIENTANDYVQIKQMEEKESFTTTELVDYYKKVNTEFMIAMNEIGGIIYRCEITPEDIDMLKELDLTYSDQPLTQSSYYKLGKEIKKNILDATLSESFNKAQLFFDDPNYILWNEKLNFYCMKFIQYGLEIDFMIEFIRKLKYNLTNLYFDFQRHVFPVAEPSFEDFYRFSETANIADKEKDILKRRHIYINAIIESDKLSLSESFDKEDDRLHSIFKNKCQKAIEIIDFELLHIPTQLISIENKNNVDISSTFKIASKKKTDFIKIISAMYDAKLFINENGKTATNKQELMEAFGTLLNDNFSSYSNSLAQAKNGEEKVYLKTFDTLKEKALDYLNAVKD